MLPVRAVANDAHELAAALCLQIEGDGSNIERMSFMDKTNKKKQGILMIVGGILAIAGAGYGLMSDEQVQALQQAFELIIGAF